MTVTHESFTLVRTIRARKERVFSAWAKPELKRRWFVDSDGPGWNCREYTLDFRVGGRETGSFVLDEGPGAGEHTNVTHYLDIVENERIVYAYTMALDGRVHSASLATVTLEDENGERRGGARCSLLAALEGMFDETRGDWPSSVPLLLFSPLGSPARGCRTSRIRQLASSLLGGSGLHPAHRSAAARASVEVRLEHMFQEPRPSFPRSGLGALGIELELELIAPAHCTGWLSNVRASGAGGGAVALGSAGRRAAPALGRRTHLTPKLAATPAGSGAMGNPWRREVPPFGFAQRLGQQAGARSRRYVN